MLKLFKGARKQGQPNPSSIMDLSPRWTDPPLLPGFLAALGCGSLTLLLSQLLKGPAPYLFDLINRRGPMQYLALFCFWTGAALLFHKYRLVRQQERAFRLDFVQDFAKGKDVMGEGTILVLGNRLQLNTDPRESRYLIVNRINKAIKQLRVSSNPAQVAQVLSTLAAIDAAVIDASYVPIKFLIWLIPVLGFLGTVLGMSQAISGFHNLFQGAKTFGFEGVQEKLAHATLGLGVAFDTTLVALVLAIILNAFANALQKREEDLLSQAEDFVLDNIVNKLMAPAPLAADAVRLAATLDDLVRELKNLSRQNREGTEQLQGEIGKLLEQLRLGIPAHIAGLPDTRFVEALKAFAEALREQGGGLKNLGDMTGLLEQTRETVEQLRSAVEELRIVNRKLGELFGRIYKTDFM